MDACTWNDLPPDNKRAIFTFLPFNSYWNALSVNREWNELMYESIDSSLPHINLDVLSWMIRQGYERIISHLLSNPTCHPRAQVIQEALDRRLFGAVNLLLDDGRATRDLSVEALSVACLYGEVPLVKRFLLLLNLTDRHNEPLLNAVSKGHREIVNILLNDGRIDPSGDDNRALISACRNGFTSIVQILLADRRVDPTAQNNRAIELACSKGHTEVVKRLIDVPGVVVEETIAEVVASKGHHEILQMILERNPQMTSTKLLLKASVKGRLDVVRLLLKRGFKKADDILALSVCHNEQNSEIVSLLIESGDNSAEDIQKAFYQSVSRDHTETTKRLLAAGAEPSADNNYALRLICTNPQRRKTAARILLTESNFKITSEDRELLLAVFANVDVIYLLGQIRLTPTYQPGLSGAAHSGKKDAYYDFIGTRTDIQCDTLLLLPPGDLQRRVSEYDPAPPGRKLEKNYTWLLEGVSQKDPLLNLRQDTCKKIEQCMTQVPVLLIKGPPYSGKISLVSILTMYFKSHNYDCEDSSTLLNLSYSAGKRFFLQDILMTQNECNNMYNKFTNWSGAPHKGHIGYTRFVLGTIHNRFLHHEKTIGQSQILECRD
ncbi:putative ankyrin repeat protein [Planoprotostelium fungivorum]|uniref:Putative ankyrin repeat protein n=1 Tax=Planoprotostelium fungivorum TaxID=1890364 RepID=A0A2P6MQ10_9EUKA|nr:putative ankyrin repeat protein [Planoprotostelium fungivorum]